MQEEELLEYVEELENLDELPLDIVKELNEEEKEWIEIRVRKHVWQALNKLKQAWGSRSHSAVIERLIRIAAARKSELRCSCDDEGMRVLNRILDLATEYGPQVIEFLQSMKKSKKEVKT